MQCFVKRPTVASVTLLAIRLATGKIIAVANPGPIGQTGWPYGNPWGCVSVCGSPSELVRGPGRRARGAQRHIHIAEPV
jgi:hypothetical protein